MNANGGTECVRGCPLISRRAITNAPRPLLTPPARPGAPLRRPWTARTLLLNRRVQRRHLFGGKLAPLAAGQVTQLDGAEAVAVQRQNAVFDGR